MKLTIGVITCDKDFQLIPRLLKQIQEKVTIPHEVLIVDNREEKLKEPTPWTAVYTFGYNAYQFAARAKIIEKAQGEYIWFIDGDDYIAGELSSFPYTEDIIVCSHITHMGSRLPVKPGVYTENLFSYEMSECIKVALWNKFIKKELFQTTFPAVKIVTNEDTLWLYSALKNARSLRIIDEVYYGHSVGISNSWSRHTLADVQHLLIGYADMKHLMRELIDDNDFYEKALFATKTYLYNYMRDVTPLLGMVRHLTTVFTYLECKAWFQCYGWKSREAYEESKRIIAGAYKVAPSNISMVTKTMYSDDKVSTITYDLDIVLEGERHDS